MQLHLNDKIHFEHLLKSSKKHDSKANVYHNTRNLIAKFPSRRWPSITRNCSLYLHCHHSTVYCPKWFFSFFLLKLFFLLCNFLSIKFDLCVVCIYSVYQQLQVLYRETDRSGAHWCIEIWVHLHLLMHILEEEKKCSGQDSLRTDGFFFLQSGILAVIMVFILNFVFVLCACRVWMCVIMCVCSFVFLCVISIHARLNCQSFANSDARISTYPSIYWYHHRLFSIPSSDLVLISSRLLQE